MVEIKPKKTTIKKTLRPEWESRPRIDSPFTVAVDGREKQPYTFSRLVSSAKSGRRLIDVKTVRRRLPTGDYSIVGYEDQLAVERKSLEDLYSTLGQRRRQFRNEHLRLSTMKYAAVIVEASWDRVLRRPPPRSQLPPKIVWRTAISWSSRYGVQWFMAGSRFFGEIATYRFLEKWWGFIHE